MTMYSQRLPPYSPTGESHHQEMKGTEGKNTSFKRGGKPGQNLGAFVKGGGSVYSPSLSHLQKDGICAACTHTL